MARLTSRINILGMCRTKELWTGSVSAGDVLGEEGDALTGVKPSTWRERGSDTKERSFLVDEGSTWRNIPLYTFNILQAAEADPSKTVEVICDEAPDVDDRYELDPDADDFYQELVAVLSYLSLSPEKYEDYGKRYWYHPWMKAKESNPELLGEGRYVCHPGKDAEPEEEQEFDPEATSAVEADW